MSQIKAHIEANKIAILEYSDFLELFKNLAKIIRECSDMALLDKTILNFFN